MATAHLSTDRPVIIATLSCKIERHTIHRVSLEPVSSRAFKFVGAVAIEGKPDAATQRRALQGAGTARSGREPELLEVNCVERPLRKGKANVSGVGT